MDDIWDGLHFDTLGLVDVLEGIELAGLLMLDDANLEEGEGEDGWEGEE